MMDFYLARNTRRAYARACAHGLNGWWCAFAIQRYDKKKRKVYGIEQDTYRDRLWFYHSLTCHHHHRWMGWGSSDNNGNNNNNIMTYRRRRLCAQTHRFHYSSRWFVFYFMPPVSHLSHLSIRWVSIFFFFFLSLSLSVLLFFFLEFQNLPTQFEYLDKSFRTPPDVFGLCAQN